MGVVHLAFALGSIQDYFCGACDVFTARESIEKFVTNRPFVCSAQSIQYSINRKELKP